MKPFFAAAALFAVSAVASAQKNIVLLDADDRTPVAFAVVRQGEAGVYSDGNGMFETKTFNDGNPVEISLMGYETRRFNIGSADTIYLKAVAINIPEVEVKSAKRELLKIEPLKSAGNFGSWLLSFGNEIFVAINTQLEERKLLSLTIPFSKSFEKNQNHTEGLAMVRVNIYEGMDAQTDNRIYASAPIAIRKIGKDFIELSLETEEIYLDSRGLCIGLEMLGYLNLDGSLTESGTYVRPRLTGKKHKDYSARSYLKKNLWSAGPIPITSIINSNSLGGMIVPERNLSIGMVLR